jgi:hypothetical protein
MVCHPVKRRAGIFLLSHPIIMHACAGSDATEVEAKHMETSFIQRLSRTKNRLCVHGPAVERVGVTKDSCTSQQALGGPKVGF